MDIKKFYLDTGSDYQRASSIMMNDMLIERMIKKFMDTNSYGSLIKAYEANDIKQVFSLSHALKGVAGNLALTKLFEIASELTEATRNKEEVNIDNEISKLKSIYQNIVETYNSLL